MKCYIPFKNIDLSPYIGEIFSVSLPAPILTTDKKFALGQLSVATNQFGTAFFDLATSDSYQSQVPYTLTYSNIFTYNFYLGSAAQPINILGTATGRSFTKQVILTLLTADGYPLRTVVKISLLNPQIDVEKNLIWGQLSLKTSYQGTVKFTIIPSDLINNAYYQLSFLDRTYYFTIPSNATEPYNLVMVI